MKTYHQRKFLCSQNGAIAWNTICWTQKKCKLSLHNRALQKYFSYSNCRQNCHCRIIRKLGQYFYFIYGLQKLAKKEKKNFCLWLLEGNCRNACKAESQLVGAHRCYPWVPIEVTLKGSMTKTTTCLECLRSWSESVVFLQLPVLLPVRAWTLIFLIFFMSRRYFCQLSFSQLWILNLNFWRTAQNPSISSAIFRMFSAQFLPSKFRKVQGPKTADPMCTGVLL